jgi:hypothetical protein
MKRVRRLRKPVVKPVTASPKPTPPVIAPMPTPPKPTPAPVANEPFSDNPIELNLRRRAAEVEAQFRRTSPTRWR